MYWRYINLKFKVSYQFHTYKVLFIHRNSKHKTDSNVDLSPIRSDYFNQSHILTVEHRSSHEYGDMSADPQPKETVQNTNNLKEQTPKPDLTVTSMKNKFDQAILEKSQKTFIVEPDNDDNKSPIKIEPSDLKKDRTFISPKKPATEPERLHTPRRNRIQSTGVAASTVGKLLEEQGLGELARSGVLWGPFL